MVLRSLSQVHLLPTLLHTQTNNANVKFDHMFYIYVFIYSYPCKLWFFSFIPKSFFIVFFYKNDYWITNEYYLKMMPISLPFYTITEYNFMQLSRIENHTQILNLFLLHNGKVTQVCKWFKSPIFVYIPPINVFWSTLSSSFSFVHTNLFNSQWILLSYFLMHSLANILGFAKHTYTPCCKGKTLECPSDPNLSSFFYPIIILSLVTTTPPFCVLMMSQTPSQVAS